MLFALAASAQPAEEPPAVSEEIVVWGEAVVRAREAVIDEIAGLGYLRRKERDGRTVFLHDRGYKGKVVLFDDGRLETRRRAPSWRQMEPIAGTRIRPYFLCLVQPTFCIDAGSSFLAVSERRWLATETTVASRTGAALIALNDRFADAALGTRMTELPDQLDALWEHGMPLSQRSAGDTAVALTYRERRAVLFDFWDTRTETEWGNLVRDAVAGFVRAVVQTSDHPYLPSEQARLQASRRSLAPFPFEASADQKHSPKPERPDERLGP